MPRTPSRFPAHAIAAAAASMLLLASCTGGSGGGAGGANAGPGASPRVLGYGLDVRRAPFSLRAPLEREVALSLDNLVYLAGGLDASGNSTSGVFTLDPTRGALQQLGTMTQPFHDAAGAIIDGRLFVFGGGTGESSSAVQAFDLRTRRSSIAAHLPLALSDLAAATIDGTVYLVGGWDGTTPNATVYATTDGTTFRAVARLPEGVRYPAVAASGATVVIAGGMDATGSPVGSVLALDTRTRRVTRLGQLPAPVGHAQGFELGGKVYVAGGTDASGQPLTPIVRVDPLTRAIARTGSLPAAVSDAGTVSAAGSVWLIGGSRGGAAVTDVVSARLVAITSTPAQARGASPRASATPDPRTVRPFAGLLLVADRGNDRLLVMDANKHVVWRYPDPSLPAPPFRFYFPDDAFFVHHGHAILVSEEENDVVEELSYPGGQVLWSYGHPGVAGSSAGYLDQPDDAYPAPGGGVMVADAKNCRVVFWDANGRFARQVGLTANADVPGSCFHGLPDHIGYPNGDTPLANGDMLVSELRSGGWIDETDADGNPVWQRQIPGVTLPSDPQRLADGSFLTVDYNTPGRIVRFSSTGRVLWSYFVASGHGELGNPSLAAPLPNGLIAVNDDFRDRMILIDPATNQIVWQYGVDDRPGTTHGFLRIPDGFDLLLPDGSTPLHVDFADPNVAVGRP